MTKSSHIFCLVMAAILISAATGQVLAEETNTVANGRLVTEERLERIILPVVKLENATLSEAVNYLRREVAKNSPDGKGVQIEIDPKPSKPELRIPQGINDDLRNEILKLDEELRPLRNMKMTNDVNYPPITLNLRDIPLSDTLKLVTDLSGVWFAIHTNKVVVGRMYGEREVRIYRLSQKPFDELREQSHNCFVEPGHQPVNPSLSFIPNRRLLIAIDSLENIDLLEKVLKNVDSSVERYPSDEKLK